MLFSSPRSDEGRDDLLGKRPSRFELEAYAVVGATWCRHFPAQLVLPDCSDIVMWALLRGAGVLAACVGAE